MESEVQTTTHTQLLALAEELLDQYATAAESEIWSRSGRIDKDLIDLKKDIANYRDKLEALRNA